MYIEHTMRDEEGDEIVKITVDALGLALMQDDDVVIFDPDMIMEFLATLDVVISEGTEDAPVVVEASKPAPKSELRYEARMPGTVGAFAAFRFPEGAYEYIEGRLRGGYIMDTHTGVRLPA